MSPALAATLRAVMEVATEDEAMLIAVVTPNGDDLEAEIAECLDEAQLEAVCADLLHSLAIRRRDRRDYAGEERAAAARRLLDCAARRNQVARQTTGAVH